MRRVTPNKAATSLTVINSLSFMFSPQKVAVRKNMGKPSPRPE
ncbi:hypothetical protein AC00_2847 [Escherichia coli 1-250-04_S3_C1]|uniref:Uncharacterized protein n=1 Tax=Escherichia coli 1-250-04_S3_C1 TaxID=1444135 RepID=A0AAN4NUF1_ECOLX|nr:hypothetical protein AC00_2847 [Escherichia coli 1-250-04_S3_C1]